jgi:hypothetical protein
MKILPFAPNRNYDRSRHRAMKALGPLASSHGLNRHRAMKALGPLAVA